MRWSRHETSVDSRCCRPRYICVLIRVWQRLLALTAAVWHNDHTQQPAKRSLTAYDH